MEVEKTVLEIESKQFSLTQGKIYLVGCSEGAQSELEIALQNEGLDAKHAVIEVCQDVVYIVDLHSKLGTYVNGVRLKAMSKASVNGEATLRFGTIEGLLRVGSNEKSLDSSGFHEEPNKTASSLKSNFSTSKIDENFVVPPAPAADRNSLLAETNASFDTSSSGDKSKDSFIIPETQHRRSRSLLSASAGDVSIAASDKSCFDGVADVDDSFIPETQQPASAAGNQPLQASPSDDDTVDANMPKSTESNQIFHICTQDFNEDLFGEEVDAESRVLFGFLQSSLVIPKVQHEPVVLDARPRSQQPVRNESGEENKSKADNSGDAEMAVLNWSASASKCTTLNETAKSAMSVGPGSCCTPDLLDLPELAQANAQATNTADNDAAQGNGASAEEIDTSNNRVVVAAEEMEKADSVDTSDLPPTQVFKPIVRTEQQQRQEDAPLEELSLSGKENVLPSGRANKSYFLAKTQIFVPIEEDQRAIGDNQKQGGSPKTNSIEAPLEEGSTPVLAATQVFTLKRSERTATSNAQVANSTLISVTDRQTRSAASFFEDIERTPQKADAHGEETNKKKRTDFRTRTSNKSSTTSTAASTASSSVNSAQPESEFDLGMCTPKWIQDKFEVLSQEQNIIATKPRILFEPDPDEGVGGLSFVSNEKISNDFDRLLSHVRTDSVCPPEKSSSDVTENVEKVTQPKKTEQPKKISSDVIAVEKVTQPKKTEQPKKISSDVIAVEKITQPKKTEPPKQAEAKTKSSFKDNQKADDKEKSHRRDGKASMAASSTGSKEAKRPSRSVKGQRSRSTSVDPEIAAPARRSTRLKSRTEELAQVLQTAETDASRARNEKSKETALARKKVESESRRTRTERKEAVAQLPEKEEKDSKHARSEKSKEIRRPTRNTKKGESTESKQTTEPRSEHGTSEQEESEPDSVTTNARQTRSRSKTDTQESVSSSTSSKSAQLANERKRKTPTPTAAGTSERKRLRSTSSKDPTPTVSPSAPRKLQVSMTMVDPHLFAKLAENSSGIWTIAKEPIESDVLIMDKGNRTLKFLIAMAKGIPIVTSKWLERVNEMKRVPKGTEYLFGDAAFEKRHKFSLLKSQDLARKQKIFEGYEFLMTPSILPQPSDMKQIITCAGGRLLTDPPSPKDNQKLYLVSTPQDTKCWHKYRRRNTNIRIISSEGVMAAVMRQQTKPLDTHLLS